MENRWKPNGKNGKPVGFKAFLVLNPMNPIEQLIGSQHLSY